MRTVYYVKSLRFTGTNQSKLYRHAHTIYKKIASKSKRRPYVRSVFFKKEKVFLDRFWEHLETKNWNDRARRLQFYSCALEVIKDTRITPHIEKSATKVEVLYRFMGRTKNGDLFAVQIIEDTHRGEKHFMSVFPL